MKRASEHLRACNCGDDITIDLHRLIADVASLRDTIAALAKTVAAEVGEAGTNIGDDITSTAKDQANTLLSEFDALARRNPLGVVHRRLRNWHAARLDEGPP